MKDKLFKEIHSNYFLGSFLVVIFLVTIGFSFAIFTVTEESRGSLNIITGNLLTLLESDDLTDNNLTVPANTTKELTLKLSNVNSIKAKFNLYYSLSNSTNVDIGYLSSGDIPPTQEGIVLEKYNETGYLKNIVVRVVNNNTTPITVTFGSNVGLYNKDLTFPSGKSVLENYGKSLQATIFNATNLGTNGSLVTTDPEQTFIAGTDPNNYIWYSGKLWRAVSLDTADNSVKIVTQWEQTSIAYNVSENTNFSGSHAEMWLNDTGSDGFLGNLYKYNDFIKTDSSWNATLTPLTTKPAQITMVSDAVGLLNIYEYKMSYTGTTYGNGYLNNGLYWWIITPYSSSSIWVVSSLGQEGSTSPASYLGLRPSINLKSNVTISTGVGTIDNPYVLSGDDTSVANGTLLNTRKSGEYINFGNGNTYRIVNIEDNKTKIVSSEPIKVDNAFKTRAFDTNNTTNTLYSPKVTTNIGYFLNNDFLNTSNGYLTSDEASMISPNETWYLGTVESGANYSLSKCTIAGINCTKSANSISSTVGMLRLGEQLSGQFNYYYKNGATTGYNTNYWTITPNSSSYIWLVYINGDAYGISPTSGYGFRPSMYLKSTVKITSGDGTKQNPFTVSN